MQNEQTSGTKENSDILTLNTVLITGANGNLGNVVTAHFLQVGYRVIATVRTEAAKNDLVAHDQLETYVVDLADEAKAGEFISSVVKTRKIEAALMLAGGFAMGNVADTSIADIEKQFSLNFSTAYNTTRPLLAHMLQNNQGRLVYIGARPALSAIAGKNMIAYGLSKSLLFKLAEYINAEAKGTNVTATVLAVSTLDTELNRMDMPDTDPEIWVKPDQLAEVLEFICSAKGSVLRETVLKAYNNS